MLYRGYEMKATRSFFLLVFLLVFLLNCASSQGAKPAKETVLLVSMDGMGWQYISGQFADTPNLDSIAEAGVKAKYIRNACPTKTWPNHHTVLTGLYPESHGIVSNIFWDPVYKEKFVFDYDCSCYDPKFFNASEPLWLTVQNQGGRSGAYFWPGSLGYAEKPTFYEKPVCAVNCSDIDPKDLPKYRNRTSARWPPYIHCMVNYSEPFTSRIDKVINWLKVDTPPQFVALYIDEPDWKGHEFGSHSHEYRKAIEMVDKNAVGYLTQRLRDESLLDQVNLIFTSDHSFNNASSSRQIFLDDYVQSSSYTLSDSGPAVHMWPHKGMLDEIYHNLTTAGNNSHMKVFKKEDIPDSFHWKHNRRIPPIFIDPEVGWSVGQTRGSSNATWVRGYHGWPPEESHSYSIFFARGPAFKKNFVVQPFDTVDLYPLMCHLLGVEPKPNNGSLDNVKSVLLESEPPTDGKEALSTWITRVLVMTCIITHAWIA